MRRALSLLLALAMASACKAPAKDDHDPITTTTSSALATAVSSTTTVDAGASAPTEKTSGVRVVVAEEDADALSLIRTERLKAKAEGRVLVLYAGAGWCEPCKRFKEEIHTGRLDATLPKLTLLVFDADRDTDRLGNAGYRFSFIPYVALPGPDGHPLETVEAKSKGSNAWRDLLDKLKLWQSRAS